MLNVRIQFPVQVFLQYNNVTDSLGANLRMRYNPRKGTDPCLIYNESWSTDRLAVHPAPPYRPAAR